MSRPSWLTEGENLIREFDTRPALYVTTSRIVCRTDSFSGGAFEDISLRHISVITAFSKRRMGLVYVGIVLFILGFVPLLFASAIVGIVIVVLGVAMIIAGLLTGPRGLELISDSGYTVSLNRVGDMKEEIAAVIRAAESRMP